MVSHRILKYLGYGSMSTGVILMIYLKKRDDNLIALPDVKIPGRTVVITGATSGIGKATALDMARREARLVLGCRDMAKCEKVKQELIETTFNKNIKCRHLDLKSLASVRKFAAEINTEESRVDILINNAGVLVSKYSVTDDGFETHLGVNYLGHFLLTRLLMDKLKACAPSRIVLLSSAEYKKASIRFRDLNRSRDYSFTDAYRQSKLAMYLYGRELSRKLEGTGVTCYIVNPGVTRTNLGAGITTSFFRSLFFPVTWLLSIAPSRAARYVSICCIDPDLANDSGKFYSVGDEEEPLLRFEDPELTKRLWIVSDVWTRACDDPNSIVSAT